MTKEKAIKYLQQLYPNGGHCWLDEQRIEAIGVAIKALQEEPVRVWHNMDEVPIKGEVIVVQTKDTFYGLSVQKGGSTYKNRNKDRYIRWAYASDLLKLSNVERIEKEWKEEPVSERFAFKAIPRLLEMIEPTDRAKAYIAKLSDALEVEGYSTDAKIVREHLKIMNGEKVPMATMDEEPVSKDLEEAEKDLALTWEDISKIISIDQQVCGTIGISDYTHNHQQAMEEVLKRFQNFKK